MRNSMLGGRLLLAVGAVAFLGCNGAEGLDTYPVTGTVTRNGDPVEGVVVSFVPDGEGHSAVGVTDASGAYHLTTRKKNDGAVPGRYKVTLAKYEGGAPTIADPSEAHADYDISDEYPDDYDERAQEEAPPSQNVLPMRYADPNTSGYAVEVAAGANTHDFELQE